MFNVFLIFFPLTYFVPRPWSSVEKVLGTERKLGRDFQQVPPAQQTRQGSRDIPLSWKLFLVKITLFT